jgi:acyl-coenzyme A thioesterase PaaI-like protein
MSQPHNTLYRLALKTAWLPTALRSALLSRLFGRFVPFIGTAGLRFEQVGQQQLVVSIRNRRKVQNHIHGVHAAAMALLAETATGFVLAMNVPDDRLMLLKSMKVDYLQRSQGAMRAQASLSLEQIAEMHAQEKGTLLVPVTISDESGAAPIVCEMLWAWLPKKPPQGDRHEV